MKIEIIEEIVLVQYKKLTLRYLGLAREIDVQKAITTRQIVVVSGIRRSGKSTLLFQLMEHFESFYYLNFDDERLINFTVEDFRELMLIYKKQFQTDVVFFDEIQNIDGWERFIRRLFDEDYKIFISVSNAKLLSSELSTHLTGRYIKIELFPFSFIEILKFQNLDYSIQDTDTKVQINRIFDDYLENGGFPELIKYSDDEFLKRIYEDVIYKDLIVRYKIRNVKQFKNLSQYLFSNFTGELSYNSLKTVLSIKSANTVSEYISYLEESYLIFELFKYDFSLKKQYVSNKKLYVIDNGVRNKIAFRFSNDKGKLLENIVFIELKRRQKELYFYKTKNNHEVDFVYYEDNHFHLIQVCYSLSDIKTKEREIRALIEAGKELPNTKNMIISYNDEEYTSVDANEIQIIPAWKWLLNIQSK